MHVLAIAQAHRLTAQPILATVVIAVLVIVVVGVRDCIKTHINRTKQSEDSKTASILKMRSLAKTLVESLKESKITDFDKAQKLHHNAEQISEDLRYLSPSANNSAAALDSIICERLQEVNLRVGGDDLPTTDVTNAIDATQAVIDLIAQRKTIRD